MFLPTGTMVTPLPEARFYYADFAALAGEAVHFGPLSGDHTFDCVTNLLLDGCHFQGGTLSYESGGSSGRKLVLRNTIFERTALALQDLRDERTQPEELTAYNNLFYGSDMWLNSVAGRNWTLKDNIFDHATLRGTKQATATDYNAYFGMGDDRLAPNGSNDKFPATLTYAAGDLGRFYIAQNTDNAANILAQGNDETG